MDRTPGWRRGRPLSGLLIRPEAAGHHLLAPSTPPVLRPKRQVWADRILAAGVVCANYGALRPCGSDGLEGNGVARGPEELVRACLEEMRERDGLAVAGDVAVAHGVALIGTVGTAAVLIGIALAAQDSDRDDALELLEALIRAALQDEDGGARIGARFLGEAARAMRLPAVLERLDPPVTHDLARAYARTGAPAPPKLVQHLIGQMDELTKAGRLPVDPDTEIERMSVLLDVDEEHIEHFLHGKLNKRTGTPPEDLRAAFA